MAKSKVKPRGRSRKTPGRQTRRRVTSSRLASRLAIALFAIALAAVVYFWAIPHTMSVLASLGKGLVRFFGLGLALILVEAGVVGWLLWQNHLPHPLRYWNKWLGGLALTLAVFGLAALFHPDSIVVGDISLGEATAGGTLGRAVIGDRGWGGLWRPVALILIGGTLIAPHQTSILLLACGNRLRRAYQRCPPHHLGLIAIRRLATGVKTSLEKRRRVAKEVTGDSAPREAVPPQIIHAEPAPVVEMDEEGEIGVEVQEATAEPVAESQDKAEKVSLPPLPVGPWQLPPVDLLDKAPEVQFTQADIKERAKLIEEALVSYGVEAKVVQVNSGPAVTQFGVEPGWHYRYKEVRERDQNGKTKLDKDGRPKVHLEEVSRTRVKVERITSLANDLALALAAPSVRIEAPVPGKSVVGIEVPNTTTGLVTLRSVIESPTFQKLKARSKLALALGKGVGGEVVAADLARMPHLLIAGATGSGKSVCLNCIISCLLMHTTPDDVRLLMIDPKRVELAAFNTIPHLIAPVVIEVEDIVKMLRKVTQEMDHRYQRFAAVGARNIDAYNESPRVSEPMPYLVVIIDELADVMSTAPYEVERTICRLAQLARATGIHLIIATQRPSVDVITGLIKANFPTRISFAVTSHVDSRTILDTIGAEKLLGRGDMLYMPTDAAKPKRLQGAFVSDQEIERLANAWSGDDWQSLRPSPFTDRVAQAFSSLDDSEGLATDPLFERAMRLATEHSRISTSLLQRRLHIGYPRAARLMDALEAEGLVGPAESGRSRRVLAGEGEEEDEEED